MHDPDVQLQIRELDKVRAQLRLWRTLLSLAFLVITLGSIAIIAGAANNLFRPGPGQTEFTTELTSNLQRDVVPGLQSLAARTLTQIRPQVEQSFTKLNERVPELSQVGMGEMDTLQKNLTANSEKTLQDTLGTMLAAKETKIKEMFPDATEDKIKSALSSVSDEAQNRLLSAHDTLLSKHTDHLNSIMGHLAQIQATERVDPNSDKADWEMAATLIDLLHNEVKDFLPMTSSTGKGNANAPKPNLSRPNLSKSNLSKSNLSKPTTSQSTKPKTANTTKKETANGTQSSGY